MVAAEVLSKQLHLTTLFGLSGYRANGIGLAVRSLAVLGKKYLGAWPLIICEATTAKRNYYRTN